MLCRRARPDTGTVMGVLADLAGVSRATVQALESAHRGVRLDLADALGAALRVEPKGTAP